MNNERTERNSGRILFYETPVFRIIKLDNEDVLAVSNTDNGNIGPWDPQEYSWNNID